MSSRTKILIAAVAAVAGLAVLVLLSQNGTAKESPSKDEVVVAIVNGNEIQKKDVMKQLDAFSQIPGATPEQLFPMMLDNLINEKLLDAETVKLNITEDPEYKKRLEEVKAQLVKQIFLERMLNDKVSDKAVQAEYDAFKKQNADKEEVHARHILVSTEAEAKKVIEDLKGGADFTELAQTRSTGPSAEKGGDLGYFVKDEMVPEFSNTAFNLKPGEYTQEPVKTQFGWHVIKTEDKRKRTVPAFAEVEAAIRNKLGQQALSEMIGKLRANAEIKVFDMEGKPIEEKKQAN